MAATPLYSNLTAVLRKLKCVLCGESKCHGRLLFLNSTSSNVMKYGKLYMYASACMKQNSCYFYAVKVDVSI